jgi:hypothetical protein
MRLKADGNLDLDWRKRGYRDPQAPLTAEDLEQMREEVISDLLRAHPTLTREEAEKLHGHFW